MKAHRVDANHMDIIKAFRALGACVFDVSSVGKGFPDLCVAIGSENWLIEIKDGKKKKLTEKEEVFHRVWRGKCRIIHSVDEAIAFVKEVRLC